MTECLYVCVLGVILPIMQCAEALRGLADRSRSLLVVWLAVRGFSRLETGLKKRGQKAKQMKKGKWIFLVH